MRRALAAAALLLAWGSAGAQDTLAAAAPATAASAPSDTACPHAEDVEPHALVGLWRAEIEGASHGTATLRLRPHPEYAQSLAGDIDRHGTHAKVAADLEDGEFTLEESADGVHIAATWLGDLVAGSCGREIRGSWEPAQGAKRAFVLRRVER